MTNTQLRIASALVLVSMVVFCLWAGEMWTLGFVALASLLVIDEIFTNFLKAYRATSAYTFAILLFLGPFAFFHFIEVGPAYFTIFINAALLLNGLLIVFLFHNTLAVEEFVRFFKRFPVAVGFFVLLPIMSLTSLVQYPAWRSMMIILLIVNFGMDTGAWFFGKNFGRHKLWPAVSPNKTIEGLLGGMITACVAGSLFWFILMGPLRFQTILIFLVLGALSQLGDLVQSKLKRCFEIKDSSALIPGHGGVYDRVDSLLFLAPFYALAVGHL